MWEGLPGEEVTMTLCQTLSWSKGKWDVTSRRTAQNCFGTRFKENISLLRENQSKKSMLSSVFFQKGISKSFSKILQLSYELYGFQNITKKNRLILKHTLLYRLTNDSQFSITNNEHENQWVNCFALVDCYGIDCSIQSVAKPNHFYLRYRIYRKVIQLVRRFKNYFRMVIRSTEKHYP